MSPHRNLRHRVSRIVRPGVAACLLPGGLTTSPLPAQSIYEQLETRSPLPTSNHLERLRNVGGRLVAVGSSATVLSSTDGVAWQAHRTDYDRAISDVAFGNGLWIVPGADNRTLLTSPDLETWTRSQPAGIGFNNWCVVFAEGKFHLGGTGAISSSADGISWTETAVPGDGDVQDIVFAGGQFVAAGSDGLILTSPDGTAWTPRESGLDPGQLSGDLLSVRYANGLYLAGGKAGTLLTSADGVTWTRRAYQEENDWLWGSAFSGGTYYFTGRQGALRTTTDFATWNTLQTAVEQDLFGIGSVGSTTVVAGREGAIATGTNFAGWIDARTKVGTGFPAVAFGAGRFAAVDYTGDIVASTDGATWSTVFSPAGDPSWRDLIFADGRFVALTYNGAISQSVDGLTWSLPAGDPGSFTSTDAIRFLNGRFYVCGSGGALRSSQGLASWDVHDVVGGPDFHDITYANGLYVAVGAGGAIYTSADGAGWTPATSGVTGDLNAVAHTGGKFVAAGALNSVVTSINGVDWSAGGQVTPPFSTNRLVARNDHLVALSANATVSFSADGNAWQPVQLPFSGSLSALAEGNGVLVGTGNNGLIVSAPLPARFALAVSTQGDGTVTRQPESVDYEQGSVVTLTAVPGAGSAFSHWSGGAEGTINPIALAMDADKSVTAHFVAALTGFELWTLNHFNAEERANPAVAGPLADPDGDSLLNLQEYFHGSLPKDGLRLTPVTGQSVVVATQAYGVIRYRRVRSLTDVAERIELSDDLLEWAAEGDGGSPLVQLHNLEDHGDGTETVSWRTIAPLAGNSPVFLRLAVEK